MFLNISYWNDANIHEKAKYLIQMLSSYDLYCIECLFSYLTDKRRPNAPVSFH